MLIFFAIIMLGIVQGLTEFLPVSSSGHLVLLSKIFGVQEGLFVSIILHVATLLSIVFVLRKKVFYYVRHPFSTGAKKLIVATIPTCIIVLILLPIVTESFEGTFLPFCFMITAGLLSFTDLYFSGKTPKEKKYIGRPEDFTGITYKQVFFMGIAQGVAVFPGISRSGATICNGMLAGGDKNSVAEFSFLMSIPIIILSLIKEIYDLVSSNKILNIDIISLIISFVLAFIIGVIAIKFMIKLTQRVHFLWFSVYLVIIAVVTLFI